MNCFKLSPFDIYLTWIIFPHAHPQIVYYNYVKFRQYQFIHFVLRGLPLLDLWTDRLGDSYMPPILCFLVI